MSLNYNFKAHFEDRPVHKISVYLSKDKYILIGYDRKKTIFSVLQLRTDIPASQCQESGLSSVVLEDVEIRDHDQIGLFLSALRQSAKFVCKAYAILGFTRFTEGYYLVLVTEAEVVSKIANHKIYKVNYVSYIPLFDQASSSSNELRYLQYLKSFDLSTGFYFSDTYDLCDTFQTNVVSLINDKAEGDRTKIYTCSQSEPIKNYNEVFMWNYYIISEFCKLLKNRRWVLGFIHGYVEQIKVQKLLLTYQIVLIAKRSRYHAGTRYLTRGLNPQGFVGNFVETEQIVIDLNKGALAHPVCSSFVQVRGSAPIYWYQETKVVSPKPPIKVNPSFDIYFQATKKHFSDMYSLYGPLLFVLNLVKKNESTKREQFLTAEYQLAIDAINKDSPKDLEIVYYHQDMKALLKRDKEEFMNLTNSFAIVCISKTGFFTAKLQPNRLDKKPIPLTFQKGVIRSNCVDCLDRTNTFQQLVGETALSLQCWQVAKLYENDNVKNQTVPSLDESVAKHFREMFVRMGDVISLQYGGSIAHKHRLANLNSTKQFKLLTSLQRYYSNTFIDQNKQNAINLFLGVHQPHHDTKPIWEITNPIILTPEFDSLGRSISSKKWWEDPLSQFHSTIAIYNNIEITNTALSRPLIVKTKNNNHLYFNKRHDGLLPMNVLESKASSLLQYSGRYASSGLLKNYSTNRDKLDVSATRNKPVTYSGYQINTFKSSTITETSYNRFEEASEFMICEDSEIHVNRTNLNKSLKNSFSKKFDTRSKISSKHSRLLQTELVALDASGSLVANTMRDSIQNQFEDRKKLTNFSKKLKKNYNLVLTVTENYEEAEEEEENYSLRSRKTTLFGDNSRRATQISRKTMEPTLVYHEKKLFEDYCCLEKTLDDLFNDEKIEKQLKEEMELGFDEDVLEEEFKDYLDIAGRIGKEEIFPRKANEYVKKRTEDKKANNLFSSIREDDTQLHSNNRMKSNFTITTNRVDPKLAQKLGTIKSIVTTLYPNLQRPNIMKV